VFQQPLRLPSPGLVINPYPQRYPPPRLSIRDLGVTPLRIWLTVIAAVYLVRLSVIVNERYLSCIPHAGWARLDEVTGVRAACACWTGPRRQTSRPRNIDSGHALCSAQRQHRLFMLHARSGEVEGVSVETVTSTRAWSRYRCISARKKGVNTHTTSHHPPRRVLQCSLVHFLVSSFAELWRGNLALPARWISGSELLARRGRGEQRLTRL
jgi:hypothetical protein